MVVTLAVNPAAIVVMAQPHGHAKAGSARTSLGDVSLRCAPFNRRFRRSLLACGIVASALSVGTDLLAGTLAEHYSFRHQSISELSAANASTRALVVPLNLASHVLMIAFGVAVWSLAGHSRAKRAMAVTVIGNASLTAVAELFFPMHAGEASNSPATTMNLAFMASAMVCFIVAIGLGVAAYGNWFRFYSAGTLLAYVALTVVGLLLAPETGTDARATTGAQERTMAFGYLAWVVVLAILLLRIDRDPPLVASEEA